MQTERPYVLTIAGFDPSSGAGLTADIKTFEQMKVYGLAVCTGLTLQTENEFVKISWRSPEDVKEDVELLLKKYPVKAVKFGIVPSFDFLNTMVSLVKNIAPGIGIVIDPVWKASTGFALNNGASALNPEMFRNVTLLTPNIPEMEYMSNGRNPEDFIKELMPYTNVLLKGGHKIHNKGVDILYTKNGITEIGIPGKVAYPKHGSGCVLSAAVTAQLALGKDLKEACISGKNYIDNFLNTNKSLLGFHAA